MRICGECIELQDIAKIPGREFTADQATVLVAARAMLVEYIERGARDRIGRRRNCVGRSGGGNQRDSDAGHARSTDQPRAKSQPALRHSWNSVSPHLTK